MTDPSTATLLLLGLAGLAAGFVDAVVGGGGLIQLPALLLGLPRRVAGPGPGHQQAQLDLRHDRQQRDVLPPDQARPAHLRPADGVRLRRLDRRRLDRLAHLRRRRSTRSCSWSWSWSAPTSCSGRTSGETHRPAVPRAAPPRHRDGRRTGDRLLRRSARPRHGQLLRDHAGRAARLQLPRGVGEGPARELGDQPGRALRLRPAGRRAVEGRPGDGRLQPGRRVRRRPHGGRAGALGSSGSSSSWW